MAGWRQLEPTCTGCGGWSAALTFRTFAERLGGTVGVASDCEPAQSGTEAEPGVQAAEGGGPEPCTLGPDAPTAAAEPSLAVVAAEVTLLQARLDDLQRQVAHLSGEDPPGAI